jgi:hypothetical protein
MTQATYGEVDEKELKAHVTALTKNGPRHVNKPEAVKAALVYLTERLSKAGYNVQEEKYGKGPYDVNLYCELAGTGSKPVLEVAAHWDSVEKSPGADDNASGVAGVLEIARVLRADLELGHKPARTVRFCLFGGEEDQPNLCTGSRYHVTNLKTAPDGVIVLEMIAFTSGSQELPSDLVEMDPRLKKLTKGDFIAAIGLADAKHYLAALAGDGMRSPAVVPVPLPGVPKDGSRLASSDHLPYWLKGWKAVMVTDTAEFRNSNYHQPTDTLDTLDFTFAGKATAIVVDAVRKLAQS